LIQKIVFGNKIIKGHLLSKISRLFLLFLIQIFLFACASTKEVENVPENVQVDSQEQSKQNDKINSSIENPEEAIQNKDTSNKTDVIEESKNSPQEEEKENVVKTSSIKLLFAGDIMAHEENLRCKDFNLIWKDVSHLLDGYDLIFANIEAPMDNTKAAATYPNFNMPQAYAQAAIDAGFSVFSLCNNHSNDQGTSGIHETIKTCKTLTQENLDHGKEVYFAGLKESKEAEFTWHLIEKNGWKILFLPITELLNRPVASDLVNYVVPDAAHRKEFKDYCRKLREENPCDLFVLSFHTSEPEYRRSVTKAQEEYYLELLDCGVDILWANHAHIIKDRKFVFNSQNDSQKIIMFANGNTISGQRRAPALESKNPTSERDNTGDGLLYEIIFTKDEEKNPQISFAQAHYITTYINTAQDFLLKPLDTSFIDYLYKVSRNNWAEYIKRRKKITEESTKDYIIWQ